MSGDSGALEFAERVLALLDRGDFTATYKYAVLMGLIDLCIERTGSDGAPPMSVLTGQLAEKVLQYYWPHSRPFEDAGLLRQNAGRQASILNLIGRFRAGLEDPSLTPMRARAVAGPAWDRLVEDIEWVLVEMPLPRLQFLGASEARFIYQIAWGRDGITRRHFTNRLEFDNSIRFVGNAANHLVRLAGVLRPLLQREWAAMVARLNNLPESRLEAFLFGTARAAPRALVRDLVDLQDDRCFYCDSRIVDASHVDHFIPWSRHPDDSIENLVIAHSTCNGAKSDHLAAAEHVGHWAARGKEHGAELGDIAARRGWDSSGGHCVATARGIYLHLAPAVPLWLEGKRFVPVDRTRLRAALA